MVFSDITEHKQKDLQQIINALFSIYDEVYEVDPEQNTSMLRASNRPLKSKTGIVRPYDKQIKMLCEKIVHPNDAKRVAEFFDVEKRQNINQPNTIEYRYKASKGDYRWSSSIIIHIDGSSYIVCNKDITESKNIHNISKENYILQTFFTNRIKPDFELTDEIEDIMQKNSDCFTQTNDEKSEENIIKTNYYYNALFSIFEDVYELDYVNNSLIRLFSKLNQSAYTEKIPSLKEFFENWISQLVNDDDKEQIIKLSDLETLKSILRADKTVTVSYKLRNADGSQHFYSSTLLQIDSGKYLCCNKDITDQKKTIIFEKKMSAFQIIERAREQYKAIFAKNDIAVAEMNYETGEFICSELYNKYEISKRNPKDVFKGNLRNGLVHADDLKKLDELLEHVNKNHDNAETKMRIKMSDGSFHWTYVTLTNAFNDKKEINRLIITLKDIDEKIHTKKDFERVSKRLKQIIANLPTGLIIFEVDDEAAYPVFANDKACKILGYSRNDFDLLIANGYTLESSSDIIKHHEESVKMLFSGESIMIPKMRLKRKDDTWTWVKVDCGIDNSENSKKMCYTMISDISHEIENEQRAISLEERYKILSESAGAITFDYSVISDTMNISLIIPEKGLVENTHTHYIESFFSNERILDSDKKEFVNTLRYACEKVCSSTFDFQADYYGTGYRWYQARYISLADESGTVYRVVGQLDDINDVILAQSELRANIEIDDVTGIRNKASARTVIEAAIKERYSTRFDVMIFLDIDNFREINKIIGRYESDGILRRIAKLLQETFRRQDIIARFDSDEFVIYMQSAGSIKNAEEKAININLALSKMEFCKNVSVHCSFGITEITGNQRDFESVFKRAEAALIISKKKGKNSYTIFDAKTMNENT